jgi:hypothetical protein
MEQITIQQALAWSDPPAGANSWVEPHLLVDGRGITLIWYQTNGRIWTEIKREELAE